MTKAAEAFYLSIKDAEQILQFADKYKGDKATGAPVDMEALKRAGLILAMAAWETYVENCVREKVASMLAVLSGSTVASIVTEQMEIDLRKLNTPDTSRTRTIFKDYVRKDVTEAWKTTQTDLDAWVKLRGEAAHLAPRKTDEKGSPVAHLLGIEKLSKVVSGLKKLVGATEVELGKA